MSAHEYVSANLPFHTGPDSRNFAFVGSVLPTKFYYRLTLEDFLSLQFFDSKEGGSRRLLRERTCALGGTALAWQGETYNDLLLWPTLRELAGRYSPLRGRASCGRVGRRLCAWRWGCARFCASLALL